jgi:hypothetical protein
MGRVGRPARDLAGVATITELSLWIEDGCGNIVSTRAGGAVAIAPGDAPVHMDVEVRKPLPSSQVLIVGWRDRRASTLN